MAEKKFKYEADLSAAIVKKLNQSEFTQCQKIKGTGYGMRTLDILGARRGKFFWLEVKQPGEVPTANQYLTMRTWIDKGALASWTESVDGAILFMHRIDDGTLTKETMLEGIHNE